MGAGEGKYVGEGGLVAAGLFLCQVCRFNEWIPPRESDETHTAQFNVQYLRSAYMMYQDPARALACMQGISRHEVECMYHSADFAHNNTPSSQQTKQALHNKTR